MTLGATLVGALLVTLARPTTWPLALLTFLVRGGLVVVILPIVAIPSAVGLAIVLGPMLVSFVFGGVSVQVVALVSVAVLALLGWIVGGGLLAALAERELIRTVATDEETVAALDEARRARTAHAPVAERPVPVGRATTPPAVRILAVRLIAHLPLVAICAWGAVRTVATIYRELTNPSEVGTSLLVRVLGSIPDVLVLLVIVWVVGEIVGALAARHVVLADASVRTALSAALRHAIRHPVRALVLAGVPLVAAVAVVVPSAAAAAVGWDAVRAVLADDGGVLIALGLLLLFVGLWLGGLLLIAVVAAWRAAVWTLEVAMTFGPSTTSRQGEWNIAVGSATLVDLRPPGVDPDTR